MPFEVRLTEADLRGMPQELRGELLRWYFDREPTSQDSSAIPGPLDLSSTVGPRREESGRVSFPQFVRSGLITPGTEMLCRALSRQKRKGSEPYIEAGKVLEDGSVDFAGTHYDVPSKLAVAVVNNNGGNTKALNGYDYLYVRTPNGLVPLQELRDRFLSQPV